MSPEQLVQERADVLESLRKQCVCDTDWLMRGLTDEKCLPCRVIRQLAQAERGAVMNEQSDLVAVGATRNVMDILDRFAVALGQMVNVLVELRTLQRQQISATEQVLAALNERKS